MPDTPAQRIRKSSHGHFSTPAVSTDFLDARNLPNLHSFAPGEVAGELSLLDAGLLRLIKTSELEDGVWMKKDKVVGQFAELILATLNLANVMNRITISRVVI